MKLYGTTTVYNEELLVPIVMPYIEKLGYDKFIVWDNGSTDRTVELLEKYPFVEIRHFETDGFIEDENLRRLMTAVSEFINAPRDSDNEQVWVTICDFDEVFQYNSVPDAAMSFREYLFWMGSLGYQICREHLWCLMDEGRRVFYDSPFHWNKPNLFRVDTSDYINVAHGCHDMDCKYRGNPPKVFYDTKMISAFHLKFYSLDIFLKRQKYREDRHFSIYKDTPWIPYDGNVEHNVKEYAERLSFSIPYDEYLKDKILHGKEYTGRFLI